VAIIDKVSRTGYVVTHARSLSRLINDNGMSSTLSTVYENARVFMQILKDCASPQVSDWKSEDVKRALNWVQYFQKVLNSK